MSLAEIVGYTVGALGVFVALTSAILAARSARAARRAHRVEQLEATIEELHTDRHMFWLYCRELIDWIYRGKQPPPPGPPAGLFE